LLLARIAGNKALPADLRAQIVKRTDGIPLFVEEMTKAVRAHDRLAAIYADFAEGFDTPDLRDARVLINQLS
jgi:predicted ATPase